MKQMIKSFKRPKPVPSDEPLPLCANVFNYGSGGGSTGTLSRLVPASDVGFSSSGNTIGVLNRTFVPSRISDPTRLLIGLPQTVQLSSGVPVTLSTIFSTSSDVDIVRAVVFGQTYGAGSQGFYFRNEVPSDYYVMIGSYVNSQKFGQRVVLVAVPKGVSPSQAQISSVPGFVATFTVDAHQTSSGQTTISPNEYFSVNFDIQTPVAVGALQPLTDKSSLVLGTYESAGSASTFTYYPRIEQITYVCFS